MTDIGKIRQWYIENKVFFNLAGIEKAYKVTPTYLVKFVNKGELYESAIYGILKFALEKGFKFQPDQCNFDIDEKHCHLFFLQPRWNPNKNKEMDGYEINSILFEVGAMFDEYRRAQK